MHFMMKPIIAKLNRALSRFSWVTFGLIVLAHLLATWIGLFFSGEADLLDPVTFIYFYATTVSTIGFGDLSPSTPAGRIFAVAWLYPGGLIFYSLFLAKISHAIATFWRKQMDGFGSFENETGHLVIVGLREQVTRQILEDLTASGQSANDIIIVNTEKPSFSFEEVRFVKTDDLADERDLIRAGLKGAVRVLVYADQDDTTLTAALAVAKLVGDTPHVVAGFSCESKGRLLEAHTTVTAVVSQPPEVISSELMDPGISAVFSALGAARNGATGYAITCPEGPFSVRDAKKSFDAMGMRFFGLRDAETRAPELLPEDSLDISGKTLYYIARERVDANKLMNAMYGVRTAIGL